MFRELSIKQKLALPFACVAGLGLGYVAHKSTDLNDGWFSPTPSDFRGQGNELIEREVERMIKERYGKQALDHTFPVPGHDR